MLCPWLISMHKFIHTFSQYNIQMPNANAVTVPIAVAIAEAMPLANLNAQIHS